MATQTKVNPKKRYVVKPQQNRLREYRERAQLSLREVSKVLDLSVATISRHESADRGMTEADIKKYCQLYKVQSYALFFTPTEEAEAPAA